MSLPIHPSAAICYAAVFPAQQIPENMLYLGCPMWANPKWKGSLFPQNSLSGDFLSHYSRYFNSVEGNTTFYADPSAETVQRWATQTAEDFRFTLKVPQRISHQQVDNIPQQLAQWLQLVAPLQQKLALIHLQLPARSGPQQLTSIAGLLEQICSEHRCAVEVRHAAFFDKAQHEVALHKLLQRFNAERVVFDSRALFAVAATDDALAEAQRKKPRLPVHAISFTDTPMLRFIGTNDMQHNRQFYQPWLNKIRQWLEQGKTPFCFFHTPDNALAPQLCRLFAQDLGAEHACLTPWPEEQISQLDLL